MDGKERELSSDVPVAAAESKALWSVMGSGGNGSSAKDGKLHFKWMMDRGDH